MGVFDRFVKTEDRSLENANVNVSADDFLQVLGWGDFSSSAGVVVNVDNLPPDLGIFKQAEVGYNIFELLNFSGKI